MKIRRDAKTHGVPVVDDAKALLPDELLQAALAILKAAMETKRDGGPKRETP